MARQRPLSNAPIVEALIDLRVRLAPDFAVRKFNKIKAVQETYPHIDERHQFEFGVQTANQEISTLLKDKGLCGYFYKSTDEKSMVQFRSDGFTVNRLHPYENWDDLSTEG